MKSKAIRTGVAVAVAIVVMVVIVLLAIDSSGDARMTKPPMAESGVREESSSVDAAAAESATENAPKDSLDPVVATREPLPSLHPDQFVVQVVDALSQEPVAGARVSWASKEEIAKSGADYSFVDLAELLEEVGDAGFTDRMGRLVIPRPKGLANFSAEDGSRWALRRNVDTTQESSVALAISAIDCVRVKVVDRDGALMPGATVAFGVQGFGFGVETRRARTRAADGIALLRDLHGLVKRFTLVDRLWCVQLLVPSLDAPSVVIDPERLPSDPIVLTLPECGSMTVTFVGRDGQALDATIDVGLIMWPRAEPRAEPAVDGPTFLMHSLFGLRLRAARGVLDLPSIGPEVHLSLIGRIQEQEVVKAKLFSGPLRAGEHLDVKLEVDIGPVRVIGRLVNDAEQDLPHRSLKLQLNHVVVDGIVRSFKTVPVATGQTDPNGQFELMFDGLGALGRELRLHVTITVDDATSIETSRTIQRKEHAATIDLGNVVLPRS